MASGTLFLYAAYLYLIFGVAFLNSPLAQAALYLFFRATCEAAAWNKLQILGLPYFVPSVGIITLAVVYSRARGLGVGQLSLVFKIYLWFVYVVAFATILDFETLAPVAETASRIICPIMVYLLVLQGIREESDIDRSLRLLIYTSLVPLIFGAYEFITGNVYVFDFTEQTITAAKGTRITSTLIDANFYGIYSSLILFATMPLFIREKSKTTILVIVLVIIALISSKNRGTWIALFASLAASVAVFRQHLRVLYWASAAGATALVALPVILNRFAELNQIDEFGQSQDTFAGRLEYHAELLQRSFEHPLFGSGANTSLLREMSPGFFDLEWPHNDFLRIAVESGYIAMFLYCAFLAAQYLRCWMLRSSPRWDIQFAAHGAQLYIIILTFVQNIYLSMLVYPVYMYLLAVSHRANSFGKGQRQ